MERSQVKTDLSHLLPKKLSLMFNDQKTSDIRLNLDGKTYWAHKIILCASSEVFQKIIIPTPYTKNVKDFVDLQEDENCVEEFPSFLNYMYSGTVTLNPMSVLSILMLADKYLVKELMQVCLEYMTTHVIQANTYNQLIRWIYYAKNTNHPTAFQVFENYIKWNFATVCTAEDFIYLDVDILERILQANDLVVRDEVVVYKAVVTWLEGQKALLQENLSDVEAKMTTLADRTMKHVRFPMMTTRQVARLIVAPPTALKNDVYVKYIAKAVTYHHLDKDELSKDSDPLKYTPRLYTDEKYSCEFNVLDYVNMRPYKVDTMIFYGNVATKVSDGEKTCEWVADIYPKGVWFQKSSLILSQGAVEVPEKVLPILRVAVTCKYPPQDGVRVKVGLVIFGEQDEVQHVISVKQWAHCFIEGENVLNLDEILSLDELNGNGGVQPSPFLIGPNKDTLKMILVMVPLNDLSTTSFEQVPKRKKRC